MLSKRSTCLLTTDSFTLDRRVHNSSSPPAHGLRDEERGEESDDQNQRAQYREDYDRNRRCAQAAQRLFPREPLRREGARAAEPDRAPDAQDDVEEEARVRLPFAKPVEAEQQQQEPGGRGY